MGRRIFLAILAVFTSVATAQAQAGGRVTGTVTSAEGGRPIPNVQVAIQGITRGALTDTAGRYTITEVPTGAQTVVTRALGWAQASTAVGRNPGASTKIMVQSILAIAFAEAIVFYALFLVQ